jgi:hypothetical protein
LNELRCTKQAVLDAEPARRVLPLDVSDDNDVSDVAGKILKLIKPLSSKERKSEVQAALVLLGESSTWPVDE